MQEASAKISSVEFSTSRMLCLLQGTDFVVMQERLEAAAHEQEQKFQRATKSVKQQLQRLEPERRNKLEAQVRLELHKEANSKIKEVTGSNSIFWMRTGSLSKADVVCLHDLDVYWKLEGYFDEFHKLSEKLAAFSFNAALRRPVES